MEFNEKCVDSKRIYEGKIINLRNDEVILTDGRKTTRDVVEHNGGSAVLCEKDGKILMVKQFRYPFNEQTWEIPAGKIDKGESPEKTAIRELEEEGGIKAERVELMYKTYPTPAYTTEIIYIYKAIGIKDGKVKLDEGEFLSSKWIEKSELKKMIKDGKIKDGKTLIALLSVL